MDVINPDGQNQSNLNYWNVTDKNKDRIVDLSDLKEIINYGLKGGKGIDPDQLGKLLDKLDLIIDSNYDKAVVTEGIPAADGTYFFSVDVNRSFYLSTFVDKSDSDSIGMDIKKNIDDTKKDPLFQNPKFVFKIYPYRNYREPSMDIVLKEVQFSEITSQLNVATDLFSDAIVVTAPGLVDALNALKSDPNANLVTLTIDSELNNFSIEFEDARLDLKLNVDNFINNYVIKDKPKLPSNSSTQTFINTVEGFHTIQINAAEGLDTIKAEKPTLYFAKSKLKKEFNISVKLNDPKDKDPNNDDILTLMYTKIDGEQVIYKVKYKDFSTEKLKVDSLLTLPVEFINPIYTISSDYTKFDNIEKEPKYVKGYNWEGLIQIENPMPSEITNLIKYYVPSDLFDPSSPLIGAIGISTDKTISLNFYLDLINIEKPLVKFPFQIPNFDESFELYLNGFNFDYILNVTTTGSSITQALSGNITLKGYDWVQKKEPALNLIGGFQAVVSNDPGVDGLYGYFNLDTLGSEWKNPFGIPNSKFRQLALEIGYGPAGLKEIGYIGDLSFGNYDYHTFIRVDISAPKNNGFGLTLNKPINVMDLFLGPVGSYMASTLSDSFDDVENVFDLLNSIFDLTLESADFDGDGNLDPLYSFMPEATIIAGEPFSKGLRIDAAVSAWGWNGELNFSSTETLGVNIYKGSLALEKIDIGGMGWFVLQGIDKTETPIDESKELNLEFYNIDLTFKADASLTLFGFNTAKAYVKVGLGGIDIDAKIDFFNVLQIDAQLYVGNLKEGLSAQVSTNTDGSLSIVEGFAKQGFLSLPGQSRTYLSLDGINDYVKPTPFAFNLANQDFTIEAWIKTTGIKESILVKSDGDTIWEKGEKSFYINELGKVNFVGFGNGYINGKSSVNDGQWHHVAVVWDYIRGTSGTGQIFIDGIEDTQSSSYTAINLDNNTDFLKIGSPSFSGAGNYFSGEVDELRIWKTARTQAEIYTNRDKRVNPITETNLTYYLPVDQEDLISITTTTVGSDPLPRKEILTLEGEKEQTAIVFDSQNDYVQIRGGDTSFADFNSSNFTVELWVKTTDSDGTLIGASNTNTGTGDYWRVWLENGLVKFNFQPGDNTQPPASSIHKINDNSWHHIAVVRESLYVGKLYLDGVLVGNINLNAKSNSIDINSDLIIGQWVSLADQFQYTGKIDEVRIWKAARTQTEINFNMNRRVHESVEKDLIYYLPIDQGDRLSRDKLIFAESFDGGLPKSVINIPLTVNNITPASVNDLQLPYKIGLLPQNVTTNYESGLIQGVKVETFNNSNLMGEPVTINLANDFQNLSLASNSSQKITGWLKAPATGTYSFKTTNNYGTRLAVNETQLINNWQYTENVLDFNGIDDYIQIENYGGIYDRSPSITVEAWIKVEAQASIPNGVVAPHSAAPFQSIIRKGDKGWRLELNGTTNKIEFSFDLYKNIESTTKGVTIITQVLDGTRSIISNNQLKDQQWHHVIATTDGLTVALYVDGKQDNLATYTNASDGYDRSLYNSNSPVTIGGYFDGNIDEVAFWNKYLTQAEAESHFTQKLTGTEANLVGYWNFNQPQGSKSIVDQSSTNNNGYFQGVISPTQSQVNYLNTKFITYKDDYSGIFIPTNQTSTKSIDLIAGKLYKVELASQSLNGVSTPQLQWNYNGSSTQSIPSSALFTDTRAETDWKVGGGKIGNNFLNTDSDGALEFFNTTGERYAISQSYDLSQGGTLRFKLILGGTSTLTLNGTRVAVPNGSINGDTIDLNNKIKLEYSINDGKSWILMDNYISNSEGGNWHNIVIDLPLNAQTKSTRFRWSQPNYINDNWAIDNVDIVSNSSNRWTDIKGADVIKAQKNTSNPVTTIIDDEALYFTSKPFEIVNPLGTESQLLLKDSFSNLITGDFNGDGKKDFIRQQKFQWSYDTKLVTTYLSKGDGNYTAVDTGYASDIANDFLALVQVGDFNGDGKTDFVRQNISNNSSSTNNFQVGLSNGDGTFTIFTPTGVTPTGSTGFGASYAYQQELLGKPGVNLIMGDFNGDHKTDFIRQEKGDLDNDRTLNFSVWFSNGNGTFNPITPSGSMYQDDLRFDPGVNIITGDYNGDGLTDFIRQEKGDWDNDLNASFKVYFSNGNGTFNIVTPGDNKAGDIYQDDLRFNPGASIITGDYNGDGLIDFIRQEKGDLDNDLNASFKVYFSNGNGTFNIVTPGANKAGNIYQDLLRFDPGVNIITGDYNGDGKTDFIRQEKGDWDNDITNNFSIYLSQGNGHFNVVNPNLPEYQSVLRYDQGANIIVGDYDGDGADDFLRQEKGSWSDDYANTFQTYLSHLGKSNQRHAITQLINTNETSALQFDFIFGQKYMTKNPFTYEGSSYGDEGLGFSSGDTPEAGEDVVVSYSTNGGQNWTILTTLLASNYLKNYTSWTTQTIILPNAAKTDHTQFRWQQTNFSNPGDDTWAIDNIALPSDIIMNGTQLYTPIIQIDSFNDDKNTDSSPGNSNNKFVIMGNGNISFLGQTISSVALDVSKDGMKFNLFDTQTFAIGILSKDINVLVNQQGIDVAGTLDFKIPLNINIPYFGTLKLSNLGVHGSLSLSVSTDGKIYGHIKNISFSVWGKNLSIPRITLGSNLNSWDDLIVETSQAVAKKISMEFGNLFDDADQLYNAIKNGTIDSMEDPESFLTNYGLVRINALKDLGTATLLSDVSIDQAYNNFNKTIKEIADAVKSGISSGIKNVGHTIHHYINGPIAYGQVFLDTNGNFTPGQNEPIVSTDSYGRYNLNYNLADLDTNGDGELDYTEALVIAVGGIDTTTGEKIKIPFMALVGSEISPLTTLKIGLIMNGFSENDAENIIKQSYNLDKLNINSLDQFDTYAEIGQGNYAAYNVAIAQFMAHNLMLFSSAILRKLRPQLSDYEIQNQFFDVITQVVNNNGSINLANLDVTRSLLTALTQYNSVPLTEEVVAAFYSLVIKIIRQVGQIVGDTSVSDGSGLILPSLNYFKSILVNDVTEIITNLITGEGNPKDILDRFDLILNQNNHLIQYSLNSSRNITINTEGILDEGNNSSHQGKFTINLGETAPAQGLTIFYTLSGSATLGEDYQLLHNPKVGQVNIAPYAKEGNIYLEIYDDGLSESPESITVTLQYAGDGFTINDNQNSAYFIIKDDDKIGKSLNYPISNVINGTINNDVLAGSDKSDWLKGATGADRIYGYANMDKIDGGFGNDILYGGSGDDIIFGQFGDDQIWGEDGNDLIKGGPGSDSLNGGADNDDINGGEGDDLLTGDGGNDQLIGNAGNDWLNGGADNDWLYGGIGNDILIGSLGDDVVSGGPGADRFMFLSDNDGFDIFSDFNPAEGDRIVFDSTSFDSFNQDKLTFAHGFLNYNGNNIALLQNQANIYALLNLNSLVDVTTQSTFPNLLPADTNNLNTDDPSLLGKLTHTTFDPEESEGLLNKILSRGYIKVAITQDTPHWQKEQVHGLAAALFGDSNALEFIIFDEKEIFAAVANQQVDISAQLFPTTYSNIIDFAPASFYDSEVIVSNKQAKNFEVQDLQNSIIGVLANSESRSILTNLLDNNGINFKLVEFNDISSLVSAYLDHTLTGIVVNTSQLINLPPGQALLDLELSTKGMSMVLPENESSWADVVRWTITAPIAAESLGISSNNLDSLVNSRDPEIRRFLGLEGNLGKSLGISNDFANQMIRTTGNYAEFWKNNFGILPRNRNHLYEDDGLLYSLPFSGSISQQPQFIDNDVRNILLDIKAKGYINAGVVSGQYPGLFYGQNGQWSGFHIDLLKALSSAIFGDANHVIFNDSSNLYLSSLVNTANGIVDISCYSTTHNLVRDGLLGIDFSKPYLFDGQAILVGVESGISSLGTLIGRRIGIIKNTTSFDNLNDNLNGISYTKVEYASTTDLFEAYIAGEIDALIGDRSIIASRLSTLPNFENHKILDDVLSSEPISFVVDENQSDWLDLINLVIDTLTKAEELGITSENVDELSRGKNPLIRGFLGTNGKLGEKFGLAANFSKNVIKSVGNYGEIFQRNLQSFSFSRQANQGLSDFGLQISDSYNNALSISSPKLHIVSENIFEIQENYANIKFNLVKVNGNFMAEIGLYITEEDGSINGISRNSPDYLREVLSNSQTIFSFLDNNPNGFNNTNISRTLGEFDKNTNFGLYMIKDTDATSVLQNENYSSVMLSQNVKVLQALDKGESLVLNWDVNGDQSYDDLIIEAIPTLEETLFGKSIDKTFDLTGFDHQMLEITFTVNREAGYDNLIGFYAVNDQGQVVNKLGKVVSGTPYLDQNYAQSAIDNRLDFLLSAGNQQTAVFKQQLISGVHYAPFLVANGGSADNPNFSDTYFAYNGLNSDGVNHVRRISDNIFGFEDLCGGGDNDFNDIIVSLSVI